MPRPLWNGSISFGLVTIPVKMYNAVSRKSVSFNQIDTRSGSRIKMKKVSAHDGTDVPDEAIDPSFYDSSYSLAPDKATVKPYALLMREMEASKKGGIARFVMRSKQYV